MYRHYYTQTGEIVLKFSFKKNTRPLLISYVKDKSAIWPIWYFRGKTQEG